MWGSSLLVLVRLGCRRSSRAVVGARAGGLHEGVGAGQVGQEAGGLLHRAREGRVREVHGVDAKLLAGKGERGEEGS